ncbi:hypothetical protein [Holdemania massiliensis]|uniref:hypothetical protein n=1 Tax=Holdemania massiliensis TaxID=1468449 RepID=UPI001F053515|nr:hypothetical protein [Holdemania massiliensis]MCH1942156.1 hypothetical protein [Holdemania massiliensis]
MKMMKWMMGITAMSAVVTCLALPVSADYPDPTPTEIPVEISDGTGSKEVSGNKTVITGNIKATQLKVTVPTAVSFDIDPTLTASDPSSQITAQSSNIKITNGSIVPIWVKISSIAVASTTATTPTLVQSWPASDGGKNLMFALKAEAQKPTNFTTAAQWLTSGRITSNYFINSDGKLGPAEDTATNSVTMKIYGKTGKGWKAGDSFAITPTFTVSVKEIK